jgi:drug/metabolite transporter (DMT)-like permease
MALACLIVTNIPVLFMPHIVLPPWPEMALLISGGFVSGSAQLLLLAAFRRVAAATLAPLNYVQLLLAVLISTLWFQRPPDTLALGGMALIAVAGVYLARANRPKR